MALTPEDFSNLTRDDINSEFSGCNFATRKKLWQFVETQKELAADKTRSDCVDDNSDIDHSSVI